MHIGTGEKSGAGAPVLAARGTADGGRREGRPRAAKFLAARIYAAIFLAVLLSAAWPPPLTAIEYTGITRDTFPVFNDPPMLTAQQAEAKRLIFPRDAVIGVTHGAQAKAYPITVMGIHELGNDTIDGLPIAVSW